MGQGLVGVTVRNDNAIIVLDNGVHKSLGYFDVVLFVLFIDDVLLAGYGDDVLADFSCLSAILIRIFDKRVFVRAVWIEFAYDCFFGDFDYARGGGVSR